MSKQRNLNIGHMECWSCGDLAAVRKDKNGSLYYLCLECGKITPNHTGGQRRIQERATVWGASGAPHNIPKWISENWPYTMAIRERNKSNQGEAGKAHAPGGANIPPEPAADPPAAGASPGDDLPETPTPPPRRQPPPKREHPRAQPKPDPKPDPKPGIFDQAIDEI